MNSKYIRYLREVRASTSIGASSARSMGPPGTITRGRRFLRKLSLRRFHRKSQAAFLRQLDAATDELKAALPAGARHWGSARKFLNIFLRDCTYNRFLAAHYALHAIEPWLEVPLDSFVAKGLRWDCRKDPEPPPRWRGVIHLKPEASAIYQRAASRLATREGVNRVDLDVKYWRRGGGPPSKRSNAA